MAKAERCVMHIVQSHSVLYNIFSMFGLWPSNLVHQKLLFNEVQVFLKLYIFQFGA